jgi:hypothetical protein
VLVLLCPEFGGDFLADRGEAVMQFRSALREK